MPLFDWTSWFRYDPIRPLLESGCPVISYLTKRDILGEYVQDISGIWQLAEVQEIVKKQQPQGCWKSKSPNINKHPAQNYNLFETFKNINILVNMYDITGEHPCMQKAVKYLFSCQTEEGDIRGIIGEQYAPYYNGIIV